MRKIKFEYGFNSVNGIVKKVYHLHEIPFMHDKCDVWQILPVVYVREFTGLTDKNGVEIFEGDILGWEQYEGTKHQKRWVVEYNKERGFKSWSSTNNDEIILGNIYENPELL
jgi:hypothetical protein